RGDSEDWIRPRFSATSEDPIQGEYSLKWEGGEEEHQWVLVSNAFYLGQPFTASVQVRVDGPEDTDFSAGLMLLETYEKFAGVHAGPDEAGLHLDAADWTTPDTTPMDMEMGALYTLTVSLNEDGEVHASIRDAENREQVAVFEGDTTVLPSALGLYTHTPADSDVKIRFDEVTVDAAPYRVPAETWTRASIPHYVVLPQKNDVEHGEGNWVGGHTMLKEEDGSYSMWYRIRTSEARGAGYGHASSEDGLTWEKYEDNPVFFPDPDEYSSNEKMSVLKVDGTYHGWYAVDAPGTGWWTGYCHSEDGVNWVDEGIVIDSEPTQKDPDVIYVDGTFYLYAISPGNTDLAVYTSEDGMDWEMQNYIEMGIHRHPTAYYEPESETFWLYAFGLHLGVHRAKSEDGIHFTDFEPVWHEPAVGIDDWREGGVDYGVFLGDGHGHVPDPKNRILYYQGRNNYGNNHPGWQYHGSERVLLAGWFTGLHVDVPTHVKPDGAYEYERFPFGAERIDGLYAQTTSPGRIVVTRWSPDEDVAVEGELRGSQGTSWRIEITEGLEPESSYDLIIDGEVGDSRNSGTFGDTVLRATLPSDGTQSFRIEHQD
ncbi:MAG: hypothetical protein R6W89_03245, partial [Candidatus Hydrogenedentota bacterium]